MNLVIRKLLTFLVSLCLTCVLIRYAAVSFGQGNFWLGSCSATMALGCIGRVYALQGAS